MSFLVKKLIILCRANCLCDFQISIGALVKLVDKKLLLEQREEKRAKEQAKKLEKEERAKAELAKKLEKLTKGQVKPDDLFRTPEYLEWDDKVS